MNINKLKKLKIKGHTFRELDYLEGIKGFIDSNNVLFITTKSVKFIKEHIDSGKYMNLTLNLNGVSFYYMDLANKVYKKLLPKKPLENFRVYRYKSGLFIGDLIDFRIILAPCRESFEGN